MPTIITIIIISIFCIPLILIMISGKVTTSEKIMKNINYGRKKDKDVTADLVKFMRNNINDKNRYSIKKNIYE